MIVGLTGGIGSGKSIVAKIFGMLGCALFNSDEAAKEIYFDEVIREKVIALLGKEAYLSDTEINKTFIGSKIFSDTVLLHQLNGIIHPAVKEEFKKFVVTNPGKLIIKETALLFEAKIDGDVDKIILVAANDELRIKRVMRRDGLNEQDVIRKIKSQLPQEEKIKRSHFVIYNNEQEFLITQVLDVYNKLKGNV
ncbi:MAG: dephospho-CoA kinase [Bacteroidetes bacterium]|jgi:dephospho-CoA kinase|nr:dephospho-CoA kinase [Bacteroidota bacterium]